MNKQDDSESLFGGLPFLRTTSARQMSLRLQTATAVQCERIPSRPFLPDLQEEAMRSCATASRVTVIMGIFLVALIAKASDMTTEYKAVRFFENPIITPGMMGDANENINGPSLIKVPDWVSNKLGKYYLYFAHHEGQYIRLAYADNLHGPWKIYAPGVLNVKDVKWEPDHVASPDVIVDEEKHEIRLYVHAPTAGHVLKHDDPRYHELVESTIQESFVSISRDGLNFQIQPDIIGRSTGTSDRSWYLRLWKWNGSYYALARGGRPLYRSKDGIHFETAAHSPFDKSPEFKKIRHVGLKLDGNVLTVFYSRIGDAPERIMMSKIVLGPNWEEWSATNPVDVLLPATGYEGAGLALKPSQVGMTGGRVRELRDPAIYCEGGKVYLLYTVEGEYGIAMAELEEITAQKQ
jgi:hypothetical protein